MLHLYNRHRVRSMLDIGCGPGGQVALAGSLGITPRGIDNEPNVDPHVLHDFTDGLTH